MFKKKWAILLIIALALCAALFCGCSDSSANPYDSIADNGFTIENLNVVIDASAGDRSMRITESYEFYFKSPDEVRPYRYEPSHGFYRDIAVNSGEKIRDLKVSDISNFGNKYAVSHPSSGILRVRVGDPDYYIADGAHSCTISYTMITPPHVDYPDALAVNAIGQGWSCKIREATVKVKLPAATNGVPLYYYGEWGASNNAVGVIVASAPQSGLDEYEFKVEPKHYGDYALDSYQGLTLYYFMPEGAFKTYVDWQLWVIIAAAVLLIGATLALKFTVAVNAPLTPVTQYYPPKHVNAGNREIPMDPLDIGYLIDNTCQASDVTSLIFYFANLGYIDLIEPKSAQNKSDSFKLVKVCDLPDGLPSYQYTFFDKLFSFGKSITVSQLTNKTYTTVQKVQTTVKAKYFGKLYDGKVRGISTAVSAFTVLFAFLTVFLSGLRVNIKMFNIAGAIAAIPVILSALIGQYLVYNWLKLGKPKRTFLSVCLYLLAAVSSLLLIVLTHRDAIGYAEICVTIAAVAICSCIAPFIARRTDYYNSELNNVLGFKDFLLTAERDRLETLLEENPQYYYDILPYANVLGVSDVWEDKFKGLTLEPPRYYRGNAFTFIMFNRCYRHSYRSYSSATISRPSSNSRSGGGVRFGGGGGGHSGGGFGGGGGGRW